MAYKTITVNTKDLLLDEENPRFVTKDNTFLTEDKIMEYLINFENIIELATEINEYKGLVPGERLLVIKQGTKYKVLEGNRRTAAMKILLFPEKSIPKSISKKNLKQIPTIYSECKANINKIEVDLLDSRDDAIYSLTKRHIDGIKKWSQASKMFFYKNLFDQGKSIEELRQYTNDSKSNVEKSLKRYSLFRFIIDNFPFYYPNSVISNTEIETNINTDLIVARLFGFITEELSLNFNDKTYRIDFSNFPYEKKQLLSEILVRISYLYWGDDGETSVIDSRKLNKKTDIENYFINMPPNKSAEYISKLIIDYKAIELDESQNDDEKLKVENPETTNTEVQLDFSDELAAADIDQIERIIHPQSQTSPEQTIVKNIELTDEQALIQNFETQKKDSPDIEKVQTEKITSNTTQKSTTTHYKPRDPSSYMYLTSAYKLNYNYKLNPRINKAISELANIEYKNFPIATMYLIRSLLESYVNEYIDKYAGLPYDNPLKMKHINPNREKRKGKELQELIKDNICNHLKHTIKAYAETHLLIDVAFAKNNTASIMMIINYYIHSNTHFPETSEILDAWSKISLIINTLDELLGKISGQTQ